MKKLILLIVLLLGASRLTTENQIQPNTETVREIIESCLTDEKLISRYEETIKKYSVQYGVDELFLGRRGRTESRFDPFAEGDKNSNGVPVSFGSFQIKTNYFNHLLFYVDHGQLGKYLKEREAKGLPIDYSRYYKRIGYNTEMACIIFSNYLHKYDGCYVKTASAYGFGSAHPSHKAVMKNPDIVWDTNIKYYGFIRDSLR